MTTPPLDLTAIRLNVEASIRRDTGSPVAYHPEIVHALLDRVDLWEDRAGEAAGKYIDALARAEAAEAAAARVEAICQDTDGNWLNPEDECNNVGGILQALRGEHMKQLGGTPTGEFADVCSCGKSYWPCDSLDGGA